MSALRKLTLSPAARAAALQRLSAPIAAAITQAEKKQARDAARHQLEALLRENFPAAFRVARPPLAIGTSARLVESLPEIKPYQLGAFLKWWCGRPDYLDAIAHREPRVNLDGSPADVPTEEQQEHAARQLWGPWAERHLERIRARAG